MAVTLEGFREYLGPAADDASNLSVWLNAAKSKARANDIPDYKNNAHYDLFIYALAAMYFDNRGMAFSGSYQATAEANARKLINSFVLELRDAGEDLTEEGGSSA